MATRSIVDILFFGTVAIATITPLRSNDEQQQQMTLKVGFLAPWTGGEIEGVSAQTSASAVSIALDALRLDPTFHQRFKLRYMVLALYKRSV